MTNVPGPSVFMSRFKIRMLNFLLINFDEFNIIAGKDPSLYYKFYMMVFLGACTEHNTRIDSVLE